MRRTKGRSAVLPRVLFLLTLLVFAATFFFYQRQLNEARRLEADYRTLVHERDAAKALNRDLTSRLENRGKPGFIADIARQKLGMLLDGEKVFEGGDEEN